MVFGAGWRAEDEVAVKVQENQRQKTQVAVVGAILACVVDFVLVLQHTPRIVSVLVVRCGEHVVMCLSM